MFVAKFRSLDFCLLYAYSKFGDTLVIAGCRVVNGCFTFITDSPWSGRMLMFVLDLATDDGATILIVQPFQLVGYFFI